MTHGGARISHDQPNRAFYNRLTDTIHLPPRAASTLPAAITERRSMRQPTGPASLSASIGKPSTTANGFGDIEYAVIDEVGTSTMNDDYFFYMQRKLAGIHKMKAEK